MAAPVAPDPAACGKEKEPSSPMPTLSLDHPAIAYNPLTGSVLPMRPHTSPVLKLTKWPRLQAKQAIAL